ncbi:MAG: alpha/beta hydrolase [Alkalibacterium sp.]|nr:alpha/beta hydrolase [Alkalibacterium sp.]
MEYIYKENAKDAPVFILLHGTGGNEESLVPLAETLNPEYNILSIRGNVNENGMNRFFKRHGEGRYDWDDLEERSEELYAFIISKSEEYHFALKNVVLVGFSNGSNIAIQMILDHPKAFKKAALFAPLFPIDLKVDRDFSDLDVFLSLGKGDPIVSEEESHRVIDLFKERKANVTTTWGNGHSINQDVVLKAKEWLKKIATF